MRPRSRTFGAALAALAFFAACSSPEERARVHLDRARELRVEARLEEARLELHSALQYDPSSVAANNELAMLELQAGNGVQALVRLNEAYRLDPTDSEAALNLASVLIADEPDRAEALIEGVIHRDPENPLGYIGRSHLALSRGRIPAAGLSARKAMEVAPDDPRPDWHLAYVMQALIREGQLTGEPVEDSAYTNALAGFEQYIKKGGESPWKAQLEEARVMAAWEGNNPQARMQFRIAIDHARQKGTLLDLRSAAAHAAAFAGKIRDWELREYALQALVEAEPRDYGSWRALSEVRTRLRKEPDETWNELLEKRPQDAKAHIQYARFLVSRWKLDEALEYLAKKADEGIAPATLRGAVASTQIAARRMEDAQKTVTQLEEDLPEHPRTRLARAQLDIRRGRIQNALQSLREVSEEVGDSEVWLLLARTQKAAGDLAGALASADKAIAADLGFAIEEQRLRSHILADRGEWKKAIRALDSLDKRIALSRDDRLLLAKCRYENEEPRHGRKLLEGLLEARPMLPAAVVEYAQREGDDPKARERVRGPLELVVRREPQNWVALRAATRLDLADGRTDAALARLDRSVARNGDEIPPMVRLVRAQVSAEAGREEGTLEDATAAFNAQPRLRGALEFVVALHLRKEEVAEALAAAETARARGALDAERRLLLGQLYRMNRRDKEAVVTLEGALANDDENPSVYFHLGMALQAVGRDEEATQALEKALAISTSFPEAEHARRALGGTRSAGAS